MCLEMLARLAGATVLALAAGSLHAGETTIPSCTSPMSHGADRATVGRLIEQELQHTDRDESGDISISELVDTGLCVLRLMNAVLPDSASAKGCCVSSAGCPPICDPHEFEASQGNAIRCPP